MGHLYHGYVKSPDGNINILILILAARNACCVIHPRGCPTRTHQKKKNPWRSRLGSCLRPVINTLENLTWGSRTLSRGGMSAAWVSKFKKFPTGQGMALTENRVYHGWSYLWSSLPKWPEMVVCHGIPWSTPVPDTMQKEDRRTAGPHGQCDQIGHIDAGPWVFWHWRFHQELELGHETTRDFIENGTWRNELAITKEKYGWLPLILTVHQSCNLCIEFSDVCLRKQICQGTWKPSTCWQLNHVPLWWLHCPFFLWPGMAHTQLSVRLETTKVNEFMIFSWMLPAATIKLLLFLAAALWLLLLSPMPGLHFSKATSTGPVSQQ